MVPELRRSRHAGTPGIPVVSNVLAVPDGAQIQVKTNDVDKVKMTGVDVFPAQPDPVDQDTAPPNFLAGPFADAPFQMNARAYNRDALVPAKPADADSLGAMRDLNIGGLQIPTAQYNAGLEDARDAQVRGRDAQLRGWAAHLQRRARQPVGAVPAPPRHHPAERERPQKGPPRDHPPLRRGDDGDHEPLDARGREHPCGGPQRGRESGRTSSRPAPARASSARPRRRSRRSSATGSTTSSASARAT